MKGNKNADINVGSGPTASLLFLALRRSDAFVADKRRLRVC